MFLILVHIMLKSWQNLGNHLFMVFRSSVFQCKWLWSTTTK